MRAIFFICFLLIPKIVFGFDVNVSEEDITRFQYKYIIDDLAVGDTAYVTYLDFCTENEKLMIMKHGAIGEKSEYYSNFLISVEPGDKVNVTLQPNEDKDRISWAIPNTDNCTMWMSNKSREKFSGFFEVQSIDGHTNLKDYLKHLEKLGFKSGN